MEAEWMVNARCRGEDPATFFPADGLGVEAARRICHPCPVRRECLAYALNEGLAHGVFGGCSERQRERLRRDAVVSHDGLSGGTDYRFTSPRRAG